MTTNTDQLSVETNAQVSTWFRIGGRADRLARPQTQAHLAQCLELDTDLKVLGDGANLLVHEAGVDHLVVSMQTEGFKKIEIDETTGLVYAGAGTSLPRLISQTVNAGLSGLQGLAGFPSTIGGSCIMNAGGKFGNFGDHIVEVQAMDRAGRMHGIKRSDIDFDYRQSGLGHLLICSVVLQLQKADITELKSELKECMAYKAASQPMGEQSAGCAFKNPLLTSSIESIGKAGDRVSAGMVIDHAHCKGMRVGGATVSNLHANFITTTPDAKAADVILLMNKVRSKVQDSVGITLENEVVIWSRESEQKS